MEQIARTHVTRRHFLRGIGLLSASAALAACSQAANQSEGEASTSQGSSTSQGTYSPLLAIIHTNDTHGHDVEVKATDSAEGNFSMAAVAALKADWEAQGYEVLLVDAGDATQGMPLVDTLSGAPAIEFMNACGYDLMAVGNHEFDWGIDALEANRKAAKFPMLSANVLTKDANERYFDANKVVELADGTKVGFFGLTTPATLTTTKPQSVSNLTFLSEEDLYACAQEQVDELRGKGCELVVCTSHLGNNEAGHSNSRDVLANVTGIDLFIDGHDHEEVEDEVDGTLLVETGCYLRNIGVVVIDEGAPANEPVAYGAYDGIDVSVQAIIDTQNERVENELNVELGSTAFLLDGQREPGVRTQETNLADFYTDAFKWAAEQESGKKFDGAVISGGAIRDSIQEGSISLKTLKTVSPFSNNVVVLDVTGAQLLEALEAACQGLPEEAMGAFPQVSGIAYTVDLSTPYEQGPLYPDSTYASPAAPGTRVSIAEVGGQPFDVEATYSIVTSDFLAAGGDTYHAFKDASEAKQPTVLGFDYEALASYLVEGCDHAVPDEYAEPQGRITVVGA